MFGANDNTQTSNDDPAMLDNVKQLAQEPADKIAPPPQFMTSSSQQQQTNQFTPTPAPTQPQDPYGTQAPQQSPTMPQSDDSQTANPSDEPHTAVAEPAQGFSSAPIPDVADTSTTDDNQTESVENPEQDSSADSPIAATPMSVSTPADPQQLAGMKQQALEHLEPLVDHLDQSAEESFKTTMMMIQANDNHMLLEKALEQAKQIEDDKVRANAMLDIINEINYFSQANQE
jgi:hypothetical protein